MIYVTTFILLRPDHRNTDFVDSTRRDECFILTNRIQTIRLLIQMQDPSVHNQNALQKIESLIVTENNTKLTYCLNPQFTEEGLSINVGLFSINPYNVEKRVKDVILRLESIHKARQCLLYAHNWNKRGH